MRKQLFRGIVVLLTMAFLAAPVMSAVSVSPNEKGDLMFFPIYYALDGIETNISVINTSQDYCAVAKVIVRSHKYSVEVLDFLIFLTPNDEFKATLKYEGGKYILTSTDDSLCIGTEPGNMVCASEDAPITLELYDPGFACPCAADVDDQSWGYIDVVEAAAYASCAYEGASSACAAIALSDRKPVPKSCLISRYFADSENTDLHTANILTGWAELVFPGAEYALFKPTVLKDYGNRGWLGIGDTDPVLDNVCDVEVALSKDNLVVPYYNQNNAFTIAWLTFPTKQSICPEDADCTWSTDSCYFDVAGWKPEYKVNIYNMKEETVTTGCLRSPCAEDPKYTLPDEVNLIFNWLNSTTNPFDEGWARVQLENGIYTGDTQCAGEDVYADSAPVIGLIGEITPEGLSLMSPAYDFGGIAITDVTPVDGDFVDDGCYQVGCVDCSPH